MKLKNAFLVICALAIVAPVSAQVHRSEFVGNPSGGTKQKTSAGTVVDNRGASREKTKTRNPDRSDFLGAPAVVVIDKK